MTRFVNEQPRTIVDYGRDPAESTVRRLVRDTLERAQGFLVAPWVGSDYDPSRVFYGYGPELQNFRGAASRATSNVTYRAAAADISSGLVEGPLGDPARRIFADRLRRRGPM